jgi:UDP-N-acetylglucosamine transferase subunit ALG13
MIFVTVGTNEAPFDRLVRAVGELRLDEEIVVQHGASSVRPLRASCREAMPFAELVEHMKEARVVVTHAGVGSILVAGANGKRPVVVPRLRRFGEAVDDHQLALARRLEEIGLVVLVDDPSGLAKVLADPPAESAPVLRESSRLETELRAFLVEQVAARQLRR